MNRHKKANPFHTREDLLVDHVFPRHDYFISHRCPVASDFYEDLLKRFPTNKLRRPAGFPRKNQGGLDPDHPSFPIRVVIHLLGRIIQISVGFDDLTANRHVKSRMRLYGLDESKNRILLKGSPLVGSSQK